MDQKINLGTLCLPMAGFSMCAYEIGTLDNELHEGEDVKRLCKSTKIYKNL